MIIEGPAGGVFKKCIANLSSGPVTYYAAGNGPPILYFHSAGGIRFTYALDELAKNYRIYMFVAPGFENTKLHDGIDTMPALADLAADFVDEVIGEKVDVIGQSFGGFLSVWFTVRHADKVGFLVPQCPSGFRPKNIPYRPADTPEEMQARMFAHPERIPEGEKTSEQLAESRKWANYYHQSIGLDETLVSNLANIKCQTLIMQGTKDGMMPPESGQLLMREIPRAKLLYVYDAGHNIEVDQPDRFVALIRDFFSRGEAFIVNPGDELAGVDTNANP